MKHKKLREVYKWKSNLNVKGEIRKKPVIKLLKDLNTEHVKSIIKYMKNRVQKVFDYEEKLDSNDQKFITLMKINLIDKYETIIDIMKRELKYRKKYEK